jgi:hypothetical protein
MNISRNEVPEFHYASAAGEGSEALFSIGTSNTNTSKYYFTDIVISNTTGAGHLTLKVSSYSTYGGPIKIQVPENTMFSHNFEIPYKFNVVASTQDPRRVLASVDGANVQIAITGYVEK